MTSKQTPKKRRVSPLPDAPATACSNRRALLGRGLLLAAPPGPGRHFAQCRRRRAAAVDPWSMTPGAAIPPYGVPPKYESKVVRTLTNPKQEPRTSQARTPHHLLEGTIHAGRLAFRRIPHGVSRHRPGKHRLAIHGLVKQPMIYDLEALARYPMVSRVHFVECGGKQRAALQQGPDPGQRAGDPRPLVLLAMDRRAASPRCSRRPASTPRPSALGGRRRRAEHESEHPAPKAHR